MCSFIGTTPGVIKVPKGALFTSVIVGYSDLRKTCFCVVFDNADTGSVYSLTTRTRCRRRR